MNCETGSQCLSGKCQECVDVLLTNDEVVEIAESTGGEYSDFGRWHFESEDSMFEFAYVIEQRVREKLKGELSGSAT